VTLQGFVIPNMKLQKQLSRKYGGKEYPKYLVTIPPKTIDEVGWKQGTDLEAIVIIRNHSKT